MSDSPLMNGDLLRLARRCFDRNRHPLCKKADVVNVLGWVNDYRSYLEISTAKTGGRFADICGRQFVTRHRALYNIEDGFTDGLPITYRHQGDEGARCLDRVFESDERYDVIFSDPFHSYTASAADLASGLSLLKPGGVLVVHDCNPPDRSLVCPSFTAGEWMGETYLAFLHFVNKHPHLDYCVVDTDWGVGLVWHSRSALPRRAGRIPGRVDLTDFDFRNWDIFSAHRKRLLRLISVKKFFRVFADFRLPADP